MKKSNNKGRLYIIKMILIDITLIAVSVGVFMLFDYVIPQSNNSDGIIVANMNSEKENSFNLPEESSENDESILDSSIADVSSKLPQEKDDSHLSRKPQGQGFDNNNLSEYTSNQAEVNVIKNSNVTSTEIKSCKGDNYTIKIYMKTIGTGADKVTYYVSDVYITSADILKSAFANDTYGKNIKDAVSKIAEDEGAIFAVNGDFYGNSEEGIVIRNGVKYRDNLNNSDICVMFTDGTMKTYSASEVNLDEIISQGAWQAWCFGPQLLDGKGNVLKSFNTTSYLNSDNPRTAIGYMEAGHYLLVTVDGRQEGYSRGVSLSELSSIMSDEGCVYAYNLDGGKSSEMYCDGQVINKPADGGREVSDIIYIGE